MMGHNPKMVNTLTFAITVPNLVIGATSEWLLSLPLSWLFHHDCFGPRRWRCWRPLWFISSLFVR